MRVFLMKRRVDVELPRAAHVLRPVLPKVPVVSADCWKQAVLNHMSIVGTAQTGVADLVRPVVGDPVEQHALRLRDRERQARAEVQDAADLPAADSLSCAPTAARRSSSS